MRKKITAFILLALLLAVTVFAIVRYLEAREKQGARNRKKEKPPVVVNMVMPQQQTLSDERIFSGTTRAWSSFDLSPKVAGRLEKLTVNIDDVIKSGELVAKLDDLEYRQQLAEAEANLELALAQHEEAKIQVDLKLKEFARQRELFNSRTSSQASYQSAESALKSQQATERMRAAEVARRRALRENARLKLADTTITVNWTGGSALRHIAERYVDEGALLAVGTPIVKVVEIDRVKAYVPVIERDYPYMKNGQTAEISVDAMPDRTFHGVIDRVANTLSENTRTAWVVVAIPNADYLLRPGMFVRVRVVLATHENATIVPVNAVLTKAGQPGVFIYEREKNTAKFVPVRTGLTVGKFIEIVTPKLQEPVITIGNHLLSDGTAVQISELSRTQMIEERYRQNDQPSVSDAVPQP